MEKQYSVGDKQSYAYYLQTTTLLYNCRNAFQHTTSTAVLLHEKSRRVLRARRTAHTRAPCGIAPALHDSDSSRRSASHVAALPNAALLAVSLVTASVGSGQLRVLVKLLTQNLLAYSTSTVRVFVDATLQVHIARIEFRSIFQERTERRRSGRETGRTTNQAGSRVLHAERVLKRAAAVS